MPNWSENRFVIYGEKGQLIKFYMDMSLATSENPNFVKVDNSWNNLWVGNLFLGAGYTEAELKDFQCRGGVDELILKKDCVIIDDHTAWEPNEESMQRMLDEKYPGLQMVFKAVEPGADIWINTDKTGKFIPSRFAIDCWSDNGCFDDVREYYENEEEVLWAISDITGVSFDKIKDFVGSRNVEDIDWEDWIRRVLKLPDDLDCCFEVKKFLDDYE